jgi:hypothetical protein
VSSAGALQLSAQVGVREGVLELIAVRVPLGYTLLVDKGCLHGDTTFGGLYMMGMISNHVTSNTADTIFLKHAVRNGTCAWRAQDMTARRRSRPEPRTLHVRLWYIMMRRRRSSTSSRWQPKGRPSCYSLSAHSP